MPDVVDMAQHCEALELAAAMSRRTHRPGPGAQVVDGVAICRNCGDPIPPARLQAVPGCDLCRDCQTETEQG